jgi:WD40 repeat protein
MARFRLLASLALGVGLCGALAPRPRVEPLQELRGIATPSLPAVANPTTANPPASEPAFLLARLGDSRLRHPAPVRSLALSADGKLLAVTTKSGASVYLWDVDTARLVHELRIGNEQTAYLTLVGFAPDAKRLLAIRHERREGYTNPHWNEPATVEVATGTVTPWGWAAETEYYLPCFGISPDGKSVVGLTCYAGHLKVWDFNTGRELRTLGPAPAPSMNPFGGVCFSPDGKRVAAWADQRAVHVAPIDGSGPVVGYSLDRTGEGVTFAVWPEPNRLVCGRYPAGVVIDPATGRELERTERFLGRGAPVGGRSVFVKEDARDGKIVALALSTLTPEAGRTFPSNGRDEPLAASADGKVLALAWGHAVRLFDTATGKLLHADLDRYPAEPVRHFQMSADGSRFLTNGRSSQTWDLRSGRLLAAFSGEFLSPDGRRVAGWGPVVSDAETGAVLISKPNTDDVWQNRSVLGFAGNDRLWVRDYRANTIFTVSGSDWTDDPKTTVPVAGEYLATAPDGRRAASSGWLGLYVGNIGSDNRWVEVENYHDRHSRPRCGLEPPDCAIPIRFSPNSRLLVTWDRGHVLWDVGGSHPIRVGRLADGYEKEVYSTQAAFTPDGRRVAAVATERDGGPSWVVVWETASATEAFRWKIPGGATACTFTADGQRILRAHSDTTLSVWDFAKIESEVVGADAVRAETWERLASPDARTGCRAIRSLAASPEPALTLLRDGFRPLDSVTVTRLIAELGDEEYAVREKAMQSLTALGSLVEAPLAAATQSESPEIRQRAAAVLRSFQPGRSTPARLRAIRAVEVLERIGTKEAADLLAKWAKENPRSVLGGEARNAVARLAKRN